MTYMVAELASAFLSSLAVALSAGVGSAIATDAKKKIAMTRTRTSVRLIATIFVYSGGML